MVYSKDEKRKCVGKTRVHTPPTPCKARGGAGEGVMGEKLRWGGNLSADRRGFICAMREKGVTPANVSSQNRTGMHACGKMVDNAVESCLGVLQMFKGMLVNEPRCQEVI
jgi:hypothetical protein